ncbi:Nuclear pore complex protein Nup160-like protein [Acromyrmex echinatior]|uniref:Nuclear pore complex protein Nup160-like protein n=1 Tax=Acromyrmex echinatior TaxID=103372 RepID=F4W8C9_ACREC|nr:Nuclear pore complex protein Nup160-like protein [Acromyrmex echinatior]
MVEFPLGYREVVPDQALPEKWKEITLNTGGSQSTLQDIKVPERAGGYSYKDSSKYFTRNRFIYWRICHDVLELVEHSLDINLANCRENLLGTYTDLSVQSIFSEASVQNARDPHTFHIISNAGATNSPVPHAAASWLMLPQEEALFALAYSSATILLLRLDALTGLVHTSELKQDSIMPKFLSGIATAFRGRNTEAYVAMSLVIHSYGSDTYLFALCREGNLRVWSCNKTQCVAVTDAATENRVVSQGAQGHVLRKALGNDDELYLGTFLKFGTGCEFSILKPVQDNGMFKFIRLCTLYAPDQHLVDFAFTPTRLWAVWRTADMDAMAVTHAQLPLTHRIKPEWETAILEPARDSDYIATDEPGLDPREAYINYIFHPGMFSLADITKALSIYRRSNVVADMTFSPAVLKERVCMAVEAEMQAEVMDYVIMDEDYLEIANRCWSKFYSCVVQYHANGTRPVGLLLLPSVYGVVLLKKSSFSFLRPMEALEHLVLCNNKSYISRFKTTPILSQDEDTCQDLITLMSALVLLGEQLSEETKTEIERELYHLRSPDIIIDDLLSKLLEPDDPLSDFDFQSELCHKLSHVKDISGAMAMLLEALTYDLGQPNKLQFEDDHDTSKLLLNVNHLFGSQLGIAMIAETITQIALLRFSICRDLLILQQLILLRPEIFNSRSLHTIRSSLAPRTVVLTQAYYVVTWLCESTALYTPSQSLLESSSQRLSTLKLADSRINVGQRQHRSLSLLELFIHSSGAKHAHILMAQTNMDPTTLIPWHYSMLTHVTLIAQLIWPISGNFIFPEWLLSSCQFLLVQEYVRLLNTWCEWNSASRKFILAVALLEMGEMQKACDHFLRASDGILTDPFLVEALLNSNVTSRNRDLVYYYLKVIKLFDEHNASDCIIEIAETAITNADADDPNLPTLHSIIFAQHLSLGHHAEAYHCLNANPDPIRRVDCLRQLVVTLFEKKLLIDLISFPYIDMYEDLERIVEGRARSVDLMENNYYNFLYSFHVNKQNMRKAASIMYEQAMRLSQEPHSAPIIAKQAQCLLACINALHHVSEKYRWIVRPVIDQSISSEMNSSNPQKKRDIDGKEVLHYKIKKQVEVLELDDIKKEYYIVDARLKISKVNSEMHIVAHTELSELIVTLCSIGLYATALHLCDVFKISKASVLKSLTSQCIKLSQREDPNAWDWLIQNDIFDIGISNTTITNTAWRLLEYFTLKHEKSDNCELHKAVAQKLLQDGAFLPQWLLISYKKRNASELLRLMLNTGRLVEASDLAVDYINAVLGSGKEHFGLETPLVATAPPVWLPLNTIEVLLSELRHLKNDSAHTESYERLDATLEKYLETVKRVSEDMIKMKMMNEQS